MSRLVNPSSYKLQFKDLGAFGNSIFSTREIDLFLSGFLHEIEKNNYFFLVSRQTRHKKFEIKIRV